MLYNPKWQDDVKADPFTLDSLIAWLEQQPADKVYSYGCTDNCMNAQYFRAQGFDVLCCGENSFSHYKTRGWWVFKFRHFAAERFPTSFNDIALGDINAPNRTFGAALARASAIR